MKSLSNMRRLIKDNPSSAHSQFFEELLGSLERGEPIAIRKMYDLNYKEFELALEILRDWRLHRYSLEPARGQTH